ncbi:hypothetical protein SISSUDRAFT_1046125 [Sistotremastrum suecicum HHB10207 ss-3]|uniref:Uncharacterized protein n=1 Tax=Sistotremastrum suecicum HHB10207 ss-3 TaxID=1314776 RepID=A0A166DZT0_9AGAM|nr:hypothetical protein SISSUDRAFT_1046125 [Sistotremastrum suecicum HHB10207 ss-3]
MYAAVALTAPVLLDSANAVPKANELVVLSHSHVDYGQPPKSALGRSHAFMYSILHECTMYIETVTSYVRQELNVLNYKVVDQLSMILQEALRCTFS